MKKGRDVKLKPTYLPYLLAIFIKNKDEISYIIFNNNKIEGQLLYEMQMFHI